MKRFLAGLIAGVVLSLAGIGFAASQPVQLIVNGKAISFPEAPPQIINGRTMVPARPLAEALGATVDWDENTSSVIITSVTEPEVSSVPETTTIENGSVTSPDPNEWIGLRELFEQSGAIVSTSDGVVWIKLNDVIASFSASNVSIDGTASASVEINGVSTMSIPVIQVNGKIYIHLEEAQAAGLIP